jgi:hypothetical protein
MTKVVISPNILAARSKPESRYTKDAMCKYSEIAYNVYSKHPENGLELIGHGLKAEEAILLATRVFAESKWVVDTQVVPVALAVHSEHVCKNAVFSKGGKKRRN